MGGEVWVAPEVLKPAFFKPSALSLQLKLKDPSLHLWQEKMPERT